MTRKTEGLAGLPAVEAGRLIRYGIVGLSALACHVSVAWALIHGVSVPVPLAASSGFFAGFWVSFFGHHHWTFNSPRPRRQTIVRFTLVALFGFVANAALAGLGVHYIAVPNIIIVTAAALIVPVMTYVLLRFGVFAQT